MLIHHELSHLLALALGYDEHSCRISEYGTAVYREGGPMGNTGKGWYVFDYRDHFTWAPLQIWLMETYGYKVKHFPQLGLFKAGFTVYHERTGIIHICDTLAEAVARAIIHKILQIK